MPSTVRDNNAESFNMSHSLMEVELKGVPGHNTPLPPRNLKRYITKQLKKRHTEPWLVFSALAIVGVILFASLLNNNSERSFRDGCIDFGSFETEQ
ncbi:hypothetical protein RRF57_010783 [Xylaria bambusicola]|uniref:Uncharacterized protein n=1 Tax=Xylaria bambusicola TaxID=326684 RepID=A0AAN7UXL4_9PEZI